MFNLNTIGSDCAEAVSVNPISGTVKVTFRNGYGPYTFRNISRRQIAKEVVANAFRADSSVGQFVNGMEWSSTFKR
jgi:hypothetical protein